MTAAFGFRVGIFQKEICWIAEYTKDMFFGSGLDAQSGFRNCECSLIAIVSMLIRDRKHYLIARHPFNSRALTKGNLPPVNSAPQQPIRRASQFKYEIHHSNVWYHRWDLKDQWSLQPSGMVKRYDRRAQNSFDQISNSKDSSLLRYISRLQRRRSLLEQFPELNSLKASFLLPKGSRCHEFEVRLMHDGETNSIREKNNSKRGTSVLLHLNTCVKFYTYKTKVNCGKWSEHPALKRRTSSSP